MRRLAIGFALFSMLLVSVSPSFAYGRWHGCGSGWGNGGWRNSGWGNNGWNNGWGNGGWNGYGGGCHHHWNGRHHYPRGWQSGYANPGYFNNYNGQGLGILSRPWNFGRY